MWTLYEFLNRPAPANPTPFPRCPTPGCGDRQFKDTGKCYYCALGDVVEKHPIGHTRPR